jgi:hypothetical protein
MPFKPGMMLLLSPPRSVVVEPSLSHYILAERVELTKLREARGSTQQIAGAVRGLGQSGRRMLASPVRFWPSAPS